MKNDKFSVDEINERYSPKGDIKVPKEKEITGTNLLFFFLSLIFIQRALQVKNRTEK